MEEDDDDDMKYVSWKDVAEILVKADHNYTAVKKNCTKR